MDNNKTLEIILKAKDEASKVLSNFSNSTKKIGTTLSNVGKSVAKFTLGITAVATGVGFAFKKIMTSTTDLSISFGESFSKMNTVFKDTQGEAKTMSDNLAKSFDLSKKSITGMIADTGDLLTGFGFSQEGALGLTEQIVSLGGDLASFSNISGGTEEAVERLRKGFLGETENLKALGIIINDNAMKEKAAELGMSTNLRTLSEAEKIQLRYKIAVDQSKNAIGDYERTQDSLANRQRAFSSAVEDTMTTVGVALEPIKKRILDFGATTLTSFNDALPSLINFGNGLIDVAKGGEMADETIKGLPEPLQNMAKMVTTATETVKNIVIKIKEFIDKVRESETIKAILDIIKDAFMRLWERVKELWEALQPYVPILKVIAGILAGAFFGAFILVHGAIRLAITLVTALLNMFSETYTFIKENLVEAIGNDIRKAIEIGANAFDWLKEKVKAVFDSILGFIQPVIDVVSNLFGKLDGLKEKAGNVLSNITGGLFGGGKATGGNVTSSRSYVVGEKGPELFTPATNGIITPNNKINNSSTININISGNNLLDKNSGKVIAEAIFRDFKLKTNLA